MTTEFEFSTADLEALGPRLDEIGAQLSERERTLLLGVFQLAADRIADSAGDVSGFAAGMSPMGNVRFAAGSPGLPTLSQGFKGSFAPGLARGGSWAADDTSVGVNVGIMF